MGPQEYTFPVPDENRTPGNEAEPRSAPVRDQEGAEGQGPGQTRLPPQPWPPPALPQLRHYLQNGMSDFQFTS